jgi:hypothetical protein
MSQRAPIRFPILLAAELLVEVREVSRSAVSDGRPDTHAPISSNLSTMSDENRTEKLARLAKLKAQAEAAYDEMYNVYADAQVKWRYEIADEALSAALRIAQELEMEEECNTIRIRQQHIGDVYRHQFRR